MGCWTESCAVSGLPIEEDQECVAVVLDHKEYANLLETNAVCVYYLKELYRLSPGAFEVFHGVYDDYGWLKGHRPNPVDGPGYKPFSLIRKEVWDLIQDWDQYPMDGIRWANSDVKRFLMFCSLVRVTPHMACGSSFTGAQFVEREELKARRKLLEVCELQTELRIKQLLQEEADYKYSSD